MTIRRSRKVRKRRASRQHGWGVTKGHKKSGIRGGVGGAGLTSHRWIAVVKAQKAGIRLIGKHGFKRPQQFADPDVTINTSHLDASLDTLVGKGLATLEGGVYKVDFTSKPLQHDKLAAQGQIEKKGEVKIARASKRAIAKVEAAGGKVIIAE